MSFLSSIFGTIGSAAGAVTSALSGSDKVGNAIGSGLSALGGASAQKTAQDNSLKQTELYNQGQIDLMNLQNEWNLAQWNRENEYNSPSAQLDRLKNAGLNPLFYGLDGNSSGTGLQSATANLESGSSAIERGNSAFSNQVQALQALQNQVMLTTNKQLAESQIAKNYADAGKTNREANWLDKLNQSTIELQKAQSKLNEEQANYYNKSTDNLEAQKQEIISRTNLNKSQKEQLDEIVKWLPLLNAAELAKAKTTVEHLKSQIAFNKADASRVTAMIGLINKQSELYDKEIEYRGKQSESLDKTMYAQDLGNEFRNSTYRSAIYNENLHNQFGFMMDLVGMFCGVTNSASNALKAYGSVSE